MTKFMYNGIKVDGKLYRCFYSFGNHIDSKTKITISARDYTHLPNIGLKVKNNTDMQTDYFDVDRMTIDIDNPMYKNVLSSALQAETN